MAPPDDIKQDVIKSTFKNSPWEIKSTSKNSPFEIRRRFCVYDVEGVYARKGALTKAMGHS